MLWDTSHPSNLRASHIPCVLPLRQLDALASRVPTFLLCLSSVKALSLSKPILIYEPQGERQGPSAFAPSQITPLSSKIPKCIQRSLPVFLYESTDPSLSAFSVWRSIYAILGNSLNHRREVLWKELQQRGCHLAFQSLLGSHSWFHKACTAQSHSSTRRRRRFERVKLQIWNLGTEQRLAFDRLLFCLCLQEEPLDHWHTHGRP